MTRLHFCSWWVAVFVTAASAAGADAPPRFDREIAPLLKTHCVKCHGPAKREGKLNLSTAADVVRGGKNGAVVAPHDAAASRLWERIASDEMPPDEPLKAADKDIIKRWITAGAPGLPARGAGGLSEDHWAFRPLAAVSAPAVKKADGLINDVDRFLQAARESASVDARPEADPRTLIRRVSFDLTGLPPTLEELEAFLADRAPGAYVRMVDRYLASPQYGVRWGKFWLDAAGYADSNGYFNADSDRPLAYRYRDYVVRAFNQDKPFDRFVREQLAGDEIAGYVPGNPATPEIVELLEATHFLRNGQDGSGESDGNPDEVRADRYYALESAMQNTASALLGLTIQCAKCHDHKFEPISQRDYYQWQAVFYPAFNIEHWVKPNDRVVFAPLPGEQVRWDSQTREVETRIARLRTEFKDWARMHRLAGEVLFEETFDDSKMRLAERWSATAPGDDGPGGTVPVTLDTDQPPAADVKDGRLRIIEGGTQGDSWISTKQSFDWTPDAVGEAIQATFDLVDDKLAPGGTAAQRIGYLIALHDFNDNSPTGGGNLLIDGNPSGPTAIHLDYPGADSRGVGDIGTTGYAPGHNYGVRVTNLGEGKYRLEHLADGVPDDNTHDLKAEDLPNGGFGFEYCCGRSFVVDNVRIERIPPPSANDPAGVKYREELKARRAEIAKAVGEQKGLANARPGKIAWGTDMAPEPPEVHLLERGNYSTPGARVDPGTLSALVSSDTPFAVPASEGKAKTTGRRLAWAQWVTQPGSRAAGLLARVQVNRVWQQHFGTGIVATPENLGLSGATPSHPELLDWLVAEFVRNGWSLKSLHRVILNSAAYRQTTTFAKAAHEADPDNRLLWRFPVRRLEAEAIRDAMLAVSGDLDDRLGGPYVPTKRNDAGEVVVPESDGGAKRRSLYLYQRRTQVLSFLAVFDAPSIVFNSVRRPQSTMPLQSLSLLNSEFAVRQSTSLAVRLKGLEPDESKRVTVAFRLLFAREPRDEEVQSLVKFLETQTSEYEKQPDARDRTWRDLCQTLLAGNEFLYLE